MSSRLLAVALVGASTLLGGCVPSLSAQQSAVDRDRDGVPDVEDAFPDNPLETADTDGDGVGDEDDNCPDLANSEQADRDRDRVGDACDDDIDGDGVANPEDAFPEDSTESADSDGDGIGDNADALPNDPNDSVDTDGDGVGDSADAFPNDPAETADSDGDGVGDNADALPNDPSETTDSDGDGVGDNADAFPNDPAETKDSDGDGVGDNADAFPNDPAETKDSDSDGVGDNADAFPNDPTETLDSDSDGVGDNADAFPTDPTETKDSDSDGVGDNADAFPNDPTETLDSDGDGVGDNADAFPNDPAETKDSDGDGVGDNADAFPNDPAETKDSDNDGVGDNADAFPNDPAETKDSDNDGVGDNADAFPNDPTETKDSDSDGVGDNSDNCVLDANADQADLDTDGVGDACDDDVDGDGFITSADCDDRDAAVHPSASEVCDGVDNNCSGTPDDGDAVGSATACSAGSCGDVLAARPSTGDGAYWLKPDNGTAFQAYCDMAHGGWTLLMAADGSSTFFGNNSAEWTTAGEHGVLPTGDFAAADYRSPAYDRLTTQAVRLCFADHTACHTFQHNMAISLMSFFTSNQTYVEYSADSYGYPNTGTITSWNSYAAEVGVTPNNGVCRWLGINDTLSGSAIGALGDNNGGCSTRTGSVRYHDDIALGLGLQSCSDANGCRSGGSGHTAGRISGVSGLSGDLGPWFVFGK